MRTIWRLYEPRILLHFKRKRQVVPRQRTNSPPHLTSNTQQWHLLSSPIALAPASSAFVIETVCAVGCSRSVGRWCWTEEKPWYRLFGHGLVWELSTRRTEGKKFTRPRKRTSVGRSSLHVFLLNSQWRLNLTVFSPPASQLAAPQHTAILFSFSTTTDVDSAWCGRQGGGGLRGGASNHMIFNSSCCLHSWYLTLAAS